MNEIDKFIRVLQKESDLAGKETRDVVDRLLVQIARRSYFRLRKNSTAEELKRIALPTARLLELAEKNGQPEGLGEEPSEW